MTSMRAAIMSNPTLAATVREAEAKRREAARRRETNRLKAQRDAAIIALLKARRGKKRSKPLLQQVLACVTQLRVAQGAG